MRQPGWWGRRLRLPLLAAILAYYACASAAPVSRDWRAHPAIVEVDTAEPVFAVGDVHGDYVRLVRLLRAAELIDSQAHWTAGKSVLVLTGDLIDKGPRPVDVLAPDPNPGQRGRSRRRPRGAPDGQS